MIHHIVLFRLINDNKNTIESVKRDLATLQSLRYPSDFIIYDKGFTHNQMKGELVLVSKFKTKNLLEEYLVDTLHKQVKERTSPMIKDKKVIDFEI
ncbi:Dabb family protein [Aquimarina sp. RZ0]|uniref:Dabb family protein n=1 Tax=Aquimarina sp. RZ0 TaxID=2607730 RepID=UPI0011F30D87|nr:Dabb family protein [Aquimarina sp. RZ0]KAA1242634.1 Dabb family protein [Aquimarina sp. RZ0]